MGTLDDPAAGILSGIGCAITLMIGISLPILLSPIWIPLLIAYAIARLATQK